MAASGSALIAAGVALLFMLALLEDQAHLLLRLRLATLRPAAAVAAATGMAAGLVGPAEPKQAAFPPERPEALLEQQLEAAQTPSAAAALHMTLARLHDAAGRHPEALRHFEAARDHAATAAQQAPPPMKLGQAIVWAGKEAEELADVRMALAQAYLDDGRPADADRALGPQFDAIVGLDPLVVAAAHRLDGRIQLELGKPHLALLVLRFARERLERMGDRDPAVVEELARVHGGAAAAHLQRGAHGQALEGARKALALLGLDAPGLAQGSGRREKSGQAGWPVLALELHRTAGEALRASGGASGGARSEALAHYRAAAQYAARAATPRPELVAEMEDAIRALEQRAGDSAPS